jgi:fructose-1,6-bisphosphatase I
MCSIHGTYGLKGADGGAAGVNATGDEQKELDIMANEVMLAALRSCGHVSVAISEEDEEAVILRPASDSARYAVVFDPVDGSSNIECSVSVGTIFGVYRIDDVEEADPYKCVLRPGHEMVAAGYVLYSTATMFNFSVGGKDVRSFVLDPRFGEYVEDPHRSPLLLPEKPKKILSANSGNAGNWNKPTAEFVAWSARQEEPYTHRYIGSMVADVHRTMLYGGIFFYPADRKSPTGKLRLLYECFPMAYLVEAAGGQATAGGVRILDLVPTHIHERSPIYIGSTRDVEIVEQIFAAVPVEFVEKVNSDATIPGTYTATTTTTTTATIVSPLGHKKRIEVTGASRPVNKSAVDPPNSHTADADSSSDEIDVAHQQTDCQHEILVA